MTSPLRLFLHRDGHPKYAHALVAVQDVRLVRQHDHVEEHGQQGLQHIPVDVGCHRLQDLGRVAHEHGEARRRPAGTAAGARARQVLRDGRDLIRHVHERLIDPEELVGVGVGLKEVDGFLGGVSAQRVTRHMPALPWVEALSVLVGTQAVVVDDHLRAGGDAHVVDERPEGCVARFLNVAQQVRQAVAHRGTGDLFEARDVVGVALARAGDELHLDDVPPDDPCLDVVIAVFVRDLLLVHALLKEHATLHMASVLEARQEAGLVEHRVLARLVLGPLGLRPVNVIADAAAAVVPQHLLDGVDVVPRQVEEVVQVGPGHARALDNRGILDVRNPGRPVDVEWRNALPRQLGNLLHDGFVTLVGNRRQDAYHRPFEHGVGEQGQVRDELGQRLVEAPLLQNLVEAVFGDARPALGVALGGLPRSFHQLRRAIANRVDPNGLARHAHRLHLGLHELLDRAHDFSRYLRVVGGVEAPWTIGGEVDVAEQRRRTAAFHCNDAGV